MSPLRPTQHIARVPALRAHVSTDRGAVSFGIALVVAVICAAIVTVGVARLAGASAGEAAATAAVR